MRNLLKSEHASVVGRNFWYLGGRLIFTFLLSGTALAFLKPIAFNHTLIALYVALGIIYFVYNISTRDYSIEFARGIVISQLSLELLVEGLLVNHVGGSFSPFIVFFIFSIVVGALYFHLSGAIVAATIAGLLYSLPVFLDLSALYDRLIESPRLAGVGISSDEAFYTVFLHLCLFYSFAFISGYLAQKLSATSLELKQLKLETGEILEQMRSGLFTVDRYGRIVYFNRAAGSILGVVPKAVRGKSMEDVFGAKQIEFRHRIEAALKSVKAEDRSEISVTGPDGEKIPIGLSLSVIKDDAKNLRGIIAVFQDLTEVKKLDERMRMADKMAAVGQLAAGIAHEIRNPLASISGSVEVLKDELDPQGDNLYLMELILKETSRLNTILSDFLNFTRMDLGGSGRCHLAAVISEVVGLARSNVQISDSVKIEYRLHNSEIAIAADEDQIKQILWNLILNAAQAIGQADGVIDVSTEECMGDSGGGMVKLVVTDNGPGIPSGIKSKIFDPFFSTKQGGTGLGLSIVVRIVDSLGGKIELETAEGRGAKFSICLPRYVAKKQQVAAQEVM